MLGPSKRQLLRMLERERERHATIEARLVDQVCNLAGKPWTPAPADAATETAEERDERKERAREERARYSHRTAPLPDE